MDEFIARLNIERFRELLIGEDDPTRRRTLLQLLAEEEEKLAALTRGTAGRDTDEKPPRSPQDPDREHS